MLSKKVIHGSALRYSGHSRAVGSLETTNRCYLLDDCPYEVDTFRELRDYSEERSEGSVAGGACEL